MALPVAYGGGVVAPSEMALVIRSGSLGLLGGGGGGRAGDWPPSVRFAVGRLLCARAILRNVAFFSALFLYRFYTVCLVFFFSSFM